ncbi:MAG: hypothetical protein AAFP77_20950 [Bacteroidota bacterium]
MLNKCLFLLAILMAPMAIKAQINPPKNEERALKMLARSTGSEIMLRWAPTSPRTWFHCNEVGYRLVRYTYKRNGELLPFEERSVPTPLTEEPIFPWQTEAEWRPLMERNNYAAIGAQSIFGDSFEPETGTEGEIVSLINRANEQQNRFGFGLFAADHSYEAADAMGLAFVDRNVSPNETYLYRVFPEVQASFVVDTLTEGDKSVPIGYVNLIDTGYVAISLGDTYTLPKVVDVSASFGDRQAIVSWNKEIFNLFYVSYEVERSEDGVNWAPIRDLPYIPMDRTERATEKAFITDSLEQNNQPYFYRIKGRTPFDEFGPPSDPVQGTGVDPLPFYYPNIISVLPNEQKGFNIGWAFNESDNEKIIGFKVMRSNNDQGPFDNLSGDQLLPATQRSFIDPAPLPSNYYLVIAVDAYGREMSSFAALAQIDDITPPAAPAGLRGTILKNGMMIVTWDENTEADLLGYRVYFSNHPEAEFSQLTARPTADNHHIDTVTLNTLTEEVFVKVFALDYRQNPSEFSEVLALERPDTIAPTAPVFRDLESDTESTYLEWANSSSTDVVKHELYRSPVDEDTWELLQTIDLIEYTTVASYRDSLAEAGKRYQYKVVATDNAGLTAQSKLIQGQVIDDFVRETVDNLEATVDRRAKQVNLTWSYADEEAVRRFIIYRARGDEPFRSYTSVTPEESGGTVGRRKRSRRRFSFADTSLKMNTDYRYSVKVLWHDGGQSPLSEALIVNY